MIAIVRIKSKFPKLDKNDFFSDFLISDITWETYCCIVLWYIRVLRVSQVFAYSYRNYLLLSKHNLKNVHRHSVQLAFNNCVWSGEIHTY